MKMLCAAVLVGLFVSDAAAQSSGIYVQAGPLLDGLFTSSSDILPLDVRIGSSVTYTWNDLNGDRRWQPGEEGRPVIGSTPFEPQRTTHKRFVPGVSVAAGVFVTPSVSLRLEGSFQRAHVFTTETDVRTFLLAPDRARRALTTTDVIVAAGWHQGESRRTSLTYLAGMVFRRQREDATLTYTYSFISTVPGRPTQVPPITLTEEQQFGSTAYNAGVMAGIDAAVRFSEHLAIVPQFRMVAANRDWNIRPVIVLRWRP
jgi:hypothetical protein